ncbi:MAG: hypothetical protein ACFCU7_05705 [Pleurocapsa sp.]
MRTPKKLLQKRLNQKLVPYFFRKAQSSSLMQNQYQNWSCVLDPAIALSHHGFLIAENMGKEIELWVVRELWNIVNNAEFYAHRPELIVPKSTGLNRHIVAAETVWSLNEWSKEKQQKDLAKLGMYWLGDSLQESLLPERKSVEFFGQWEAMASALDQKNEQAAKYCDSDVLTLAFRDTIALVASLKSAFILTYQLPTDFSENNSPLICKVLESWGISCQILSRRNSVVAMERQYLRQLIIRAGLGKLLLAGVNLVVFHLVIPAIDTSTKVFQPNSESALAQESYFWNNVKGIGYYL